MIGNNDKHLRIWREESTLGAIPEQKGISVGRQHLYNHRSSRKILLVLERLTGSVLFLLEPE